MWRGAVVAVGLLLASVATGEVARAAPPSAATFHGLNPARLLDTRPGAATVDGLFQGGGVVGPASVTSVTVVGRGGVPAGAVAGAVALNVTVVGPSAVSFLTVWPAGAAQPTASNLNLQPGVTTPNMVIVPVGVDGKVSMYNDAGSTHVLVDVLGWFPTTVNPAVTTRISVATGDVQAVGGQSAHPDVSADGRFVTYYSAATNLVVDDTNGFNDVFLFDRVAGTTTRVSVATGGAQAVGGASVHPSISADGHYIAFHAAATNLVAGDSNGALDVFVHDRLNGATTRVNLTSNGVQATGGDSTWSTLSADGRYLGYSSAADNLVVNDTNARIDVFVYDRVSGVTRRVNVATDGTQASAGDSDQPQISDDGRYVTYHSGATNLVAGDTNAVYDVFLHDVVSGTTSRVSVPATGGQAVGGNSLYPALSDDGRYVAFSSEATNLIVGDTFGFGDVFVRDQGTT